MRFSSSLRLPSLSLLVCLLLPTSAARVALGQPANKAAADVLFDQGKKLMGESKFAEACPRFAESQRLDPAPGTLVWLADCYEKNGQTASAWSTYREALAAAKKAGQAQRESLARERIAALEKILSTLTIRVEEGSLAGLTVKIDGQTLGQPLWGTAIPYDPGPHTIDASAPGRAAFQVKVDLGKDGVQKVIEIPALKPAPAASPTAPASSSSPVAPATAGPPATGAPTAAPASGSPRRTVGFVVGGAGLVVGISGAILAVAARSAAQQAIDDCRAHTFCTKSDLDAHDSAKGRNSLGLILGGVGAALTVGGAVLVFTSPKETPSSATWIAPQLGRSFSGLSLGGAF